MCIDDALLAKLEKLAMIEIAAEKKEDIKRELAEIVNFVENLNHLDTASLDATFSTLESKTPLREDEPFCEESIGRSVIKNAPKSQDNYFIVPKIIG